MPRNVVKLYRQSKPKSGGDQHAPSDDEKRPKKQPQRPHYLPLWVALRGMTRPQFIEKIGIDKGLVSKWYRGATPQEPAQKLIAAALDIEPSDIFQHPDDVWFRLFNKGRDPEDVAHIKREMERRWPRVAKP